jgi:predicted Zn finger-like uncharacterized protein
MKFVCDRCQTKYSIADEKVRGKILKVRCKSCTNIITVREDGAGAAAGSGSAAARRPSAPAATIGSPPARPPTPAIPRAPLAPPVERRAAPRPEPPADDGVAWYMALDGNRTGPFTRKQLIDKVAPLSKDADLHVWNEKLGSWKPPTDVPALAGELSARRRPPTPVSSSPSAPPAPPPFPGAPRRPTAPSVPLAAAGASAPARQTGTHAVVGSPIGPGVGLKLPPPVAPPGGRRPTGPVARPAGLAASALAPAAEPGLDLDPSSMLETPAPQPHMLHGLGTNGVSHAVPNGTSGAADRSDVLNTLNLASSSGAAPAPRLLSSEAVVGWQPTGAQQTGTRQKMFRAVLAFIGVVAAICIVLMFNANKKVKPVAAPPPKAIADPLAGVVDNPPPNLPVAPPPPQAAAPAPEAQPEPASPHGRGKGHPTPRGRAATGPASTQPPPVGPSTSPPPAVADNSANARYRDTGRALNITGGGGVSRPAPSQADIAKVIHNNMGGIKNCYQRALLRDNSLTHGKITVKLNIGISGHVKHESIDGPTQFRALEPCIKDVVGHWAFPQAGDEYGTEFVYVFQGNE